MKNPLGVGYLSIPHDDGSQSTRHENSILGEFYKLTALRDTASRSDYALETICALYVRELDETNPDLAKRYEQPLLQLCRFEYRGKPVGKLLVNAELEGIQLRKCAETFPSEPPGAKRQTTLSIAD